MKNTQWRKLPGFPATRSTNRASVALPTLWSDDACNRRDILSDPLGLLCDERSDLRKCHTVFTVDPDGDLNSDEIEASSSGSDEDTQLTAADIASFDRYVEELARRKRNDRNR